MPPRGSSRYASGLNQFRTRNALGCMTKPPGHRKHVLDDTQFRLLMRALRINSCNDSYQLAITAVKDVIEKRQKRFAENTPFARASLFRCDALGNSADHRIPKVNASFRGKDSSLSRFDMTLTRNLRYPFRTGRLTERYCKPPLTRFISRFVGLRGTQSF